MDRAATDRRKLGRGLMGMLSAPVEVRPEPQAIVVTTIDDTRIASSKDPSLRGLRQLELADIVPNRFQPRQSIAPAALEPLASSIRTSGLIQPIAVRPLPAPTTSGARYELVAGERRWRAAAMAGLARIPAVVVELDDRGSAEWAIVENVQREDLNPIDRARAFRGLIEQFGLTQSEVAQRVGLERSSVANIIRLTELEEQIQHMVVDGSLSAGHARALLGAPASAGRVAAAVLAAQDGWSVRQTEAWAAEAAASAAGDAHKPKQPSHADVTAERADLERQLSEHLGTRVRVQTNAAGTKGRLVIEFYDLEHFDALMNKLGFRMSS